MKLTIPRIMLLTAAPLLFGSAVYAQEINVRARIPFDFVLGEEVHPAGNYAVQTAMGNTHFLAIKNVGRTTQALTLSLPCISSERTIPANQAKLLFRRIGNTYFLFRVLVGGSTAGWEFPGSHREAQMAENGPETETVIVATNIVH